MNILLTSAGRRSYIVDYFKKCVGIEKVFASNSEYSIALQRSDGYFISPLIYSEDYIPSIIDFCKKNDIKVVISLFDIDLLVLAKNSHIFSGAGIELILAPSDFVEICNDKFKTYEFLKQIGVSTPKTYKTLSETEEALSKGEISYPILIKPRWGMASMGIYKVYDDSELKILSKRCERDIFNSYLKYESHLTSAEPVIYQEMLLGEEYGIDALNDLNGEFIACFPKQKVTMRSGETDLGKTADPTPFIETARTISENSGHHGILSIDCFKNETGIHVIEMNCRISGHYPLSYLAGFNYPQIIADWLNNKPLNSDNLNFKIGLNIIKDLVPTILNEMHDEH